MTTPSTASRSKQVLYWCFAIVVVGLLFAIERARVAANNKLGKERFDAIQARLDRIEDALSSMEDARQARALTPDAATKLAVEAERIQARLVGLERRLEQTQRNAASATRIVPTSATLEPSSSRPRVELPAAGERSFSGRRWGHEQAAGPPNTPLAGDEVTAWASRQADAGPEWLRVDYAQAVDVAEIRIRESYNPGAISRVTGVVNGQEVVLWEGTATAGTAPCDFVVPVQSQLVAQSIVVHLDTARVPGWNEIDAVELVGKDGTRQWAQSANASSSYADNLGPAASSDAPVESFQSIEPIPAPQRTR
jgi:hypothetical protein